MTDFKLKGTIKNISIKKVITLIFTIAILLATSRIAYVLYDFYNNFIYLNK